MNKNTIILGNCFTKEIHCYDWFETLIVVLFVASLGFGDVVSFGSIKLSYITTICFFIYSVFIKKKTSVFRDYKKQVFLVFSCFWVIYGLFQLIWVKDFSLWLYFYRSLLINMLIVFLLLNYTENHIDWKRILYGIFVLSVISLIVGIWEHFTGNHIVSLDFNNINANTFAIRRYQPVSFYGNVNDNATILFFGICVSALIFDNSQKNIISVLMFLLFILLSVVEIIWTGSRAIIYSLPLLGILISLFFILHHLTKRKWSSTQKALLFFFVLIIFSIIILLILHPLTYYLGFISEGSDYASDLYRLSIVSNSFNSFLNTGGFGLGAGQSILENGINLHSFYLELIFEYGLWVGGFMIIILVKIIFDRPKTNKNLSNYIVCSFPLVLLLVGVSSSKMLSLRLFWVLFSIVYLYKYMDLDSFGYYLKR